MPNTNQEPMRYWPSEYNRCREIETPYRKLYGHIQFWSNETTRGFHNAILFLTTELNYPMPRLLELLPSHKLYKEGMNGLYLSGSVKSETKTSCHILLRHYANIITLIHEYAHHIAWLDRLKVSDDFAIHHGADFLTIEKMLLEMFHQAKKEGRL